MSSKPYRFVGAHSIIFDHEELTEFGQRTLLTDEQYETVLAGGCIVVPEDQFFEIFTPAEVKARSFPRHPGQWLNAPEELKERKKQAVRIGVEAHYAAIKRAEDRNAAAHAEWLAKQKPAPATTEEHES